MRTNGKQFNGYNPNGDIFSFEDRELFLKVVFETAPVIKSGKRLFYYNIPASFDIETTSFYAEDSITDPKHPEYIKQATMYIWQFGINGHVCYGRTWHEFGDFVESLVNYAKLTRNLRLVIYVHNLTFEFQFIKNWFQWQDVFAIKTRKPIYAVTGGLEFRCSYYLSNYNLAYIGDNLLTMFPIKKLVGDLDYSKIRHSYTDLTEKELNYCINDVRVVMSYIEQKIIEDKGINNIPLTNTGYVRNHCRKVCFGEDGTEDDRREGLNYRAIIRSLVMSYPEYLQAKRAFGGGFTHASALWANRTLENVDINDDEASAYPAQAAYKYFPMSSAIYIGTVKTNAELRQYLKTYCCMFDLYIENIRPRVLFENILSVSRCEFIEDATYKTNNGRIISCDGLLKTTVTELDFEMLEKFYVWDGIYVNDLRIYKRGYLPTRLVMAILDFYSDKTTLKDVEGKETQYMVGKNMLNSTYGMMVTDIVRDIFEFEGNWNKSKADGDYSIESYNKSYNRFLFYPWGVWITAHARHCLYRAILELGEDYVYSDTDCVKGFNYEKHKQWFHNYNVEIKALAIQASARHNIPMEYFMPKTPKGVEKLLGVWEHDPGYIRFKTCGAKRYLYEQMNFKTSQLELHMTVAGLGKQKALAYLLKKFKDNHTEIFDYFENGMEIPASETGKLTHTYIDDSQMGTITDYNGVSMGYYEKSSVHLENASFEMSLLPEYLGYLSQLRIEVGTYEK